MNEKYLFYVSQAMLLACENCPNTNNAQTIKINTPLGLDGAIVKFNEIPPIICLQGSNEWLDWIINLLGFTWKSYHLGFLLSFRSSFGEISTALSSLSESPTEDVLIGGFSNGAAIGYHISLKLSSLNRNVYFYSWGQPKLKTKKRAGEENSIKEYIRFYNPRDLVTHSPINLYHSKLGTEINWKGNPHNLKKYIEITVSSLSSLSS